MAPTRTAPIPSGLLAAVVVGLTLCSSCALKYGGAEYERGDIESQADGELLDLDITVYKFGAREGHSEVGVSLSRNKFKAPGPDDVLTDVDFTWRYFLAPPGGFTPYIGAGVGYWGFGFRDEAGDACHGDVGGVICQPYDAVKVDSSARGWNPHLTLGSYYPLSTTWDLVTELNYEFDKEDKGLDFEAIEFLVGIRFGTDN